VGESKEEKKTMTRVKVKFLAADPSSNKLSVVLMDLENRKALPIWIGPFEANAIAPRLKNLCQQTSNP
jgi:bifunctional DNase/RNase